MPPPHQGALKGLLLGSLTARRAQPRRPSLQVRVRSSGTVACPQMCGHREYRAAWGAFWHLPHTLPVLAGSGSHSALPRRLTRSQSRVHRHDIPTKALPLHRSLGPVYHCQLQATFTHALPLTSMLSSIFLGQGIGIGLLSLYPGAEAAACLPAGGAGPGHLRSHGVMGGPAPARVGPIRVRDERL